MKTIKTLACLIVMGTMLVGITACAPTRTSASTGGYIDDSVITTKVKSQLLSAPNLKSNEIKVKTFKGEVQLSGFVSSRKDINEAVEITKGIPGVSKVTNDMQLK